MTPDQVIAHFGGTQTAAARELGCNQSTVSDWVKSGFVPSDWQHYIARRAGGALAVDTDDIIRRVEAHISRRRQAIQVA